MWTELIPLIAQGAGMIYDQVFGKADRQQYADQQANLMKQDLEFKQKSWEEQKKIIADENAMKKGAYDFAVKVYNDQEAQRAIDRARQDEERKRQADYIQQTQDLLKTPVQQYDQKNVDANVALVKQQLDKSMAEQRPGVLEGLATRGVRTSGISEDALKPLNTAYTYGLNNATTQATLAELLAARTASNQRYQDILNFNKGVIGMPISGISPSASLPQAPNFSMNPGMPDNSNYLQSQLEQYALPLYNSRVVSGFINNLGSAAAYGMNNGGFNFGSGGGNEVVNPGGLGSNLNATGYDDMMNTLRGRTSFAGRY